MTLKQMIKYLDDSIFNTALNKIGIRRSTLTAFRNHSTRLDIRALKDKFDAHSRVELTNKIEVALQEVLGYDINFEAAYEAGFYDDLPGGE